jgi:hypothetical protein
MVSSILLDHLLLRASVIIARFERKTSLTRYCAPSALARDVTIPINRITRRRPASAFWRPVDVAFNYAKTTSMRS